jgi:hypothetical protein
MVLAGCRRFVALEKRYQLAPESVLPSDVRLAPAEVREAYRFAIANRDILRYIPCNCGCGSEGHTSNASCYLKNVSTAYYLLSVRLPDNLQFGRMSLA